MDEVASQVNISRALAIRGWMSENELIWLAYRARECSKIVEFGSFLGRSTRAMADNTSGVIYAVDPWNGDYPGYEMINTYVMPEFLTNLDDHIKSGKVIPYRGWSECFGEVENVDMVFIDGDHRYNEVKKDIRKARLLLKNYGIMCGHDYQFPDVKRAVHRLIDEVSVEGTIWWTRKS